MMVVVDCFLKNANDLQKSLDCLRSNIVEHGKLLSKGQNSKAKVVYEKITCSFKELGILLERFSWSFLMPLPDDLIQSARKWSSSFENLLRQMVIKCFQKESLVSFVDPLGAAALSMGQLLSHQAVSTAEGKKARGRGVPKK